MVEKFGTNQLTKFRQENCQRTSGFLIQEFWLSNQTIALLIENCLGVGREVGDTQDVACFSKCLSLLIGLLTHKLLDELLYWIE